MEREDLSLQLTTTCSFVFFSKGSQTACATLAVLSRCVGVKLLAKEEVNRFNLVGTEFLFQPPADNPEKKLLTFLLFRLEGLEYG